MEVDPGACEALISRQPPHGIVQATAPLLDGFGYTESELVGCSVTVLQGAGTCLMTSSALLTAIQVGNLMDWNALWHAECRPIAPIWACCCPLKYFVTAGPRLVALHHHVPCASQDGRECSASLVTYLKNGAPVLSFVEARPAPDGIHGLLRFALGVTPTAPPPLPLRSSCKQLPRREGAIDTPVGVASSSSKGAVDFDGCAFQSHVRCLGCLVLPASMVGCDHLLSTRNCLYEQAYVATELHAPWRIISSNAQFCEIVGHSEAKLQGATFDLLHGPATDQTALRSLRRACVLRHPLAIWLVAYDAVKAP